MKRELLAATALCGVAAYIAFQIDQPTRSEPPSSTPSQLNQPVPSRLITPGELGKVSSEVLSLYPQLAGYPMRWESVSTPHTKIKVFNFSDANFNAPSALAIYHYLESLAKTGKIPSFPEFHLSPKVQEERVLFIVSQKHPAHSWDKNQTLTSLSQLGITKGNGSASIIRVLNTDGLLQLEQKGIPKGRGSIAAWTSPSMFVNTALAVEACHAFLYAESANNDGEPITYMQGVYPFTPDEKFCNSLGLAVAFRLNGAKYNEYVAYTKGATFMGELQLNPYIFKEEFYQQIPAVRPVLDLK